MVFLVDLFRHRLTCRARVGKRSCNDRNYCEFRNTTEILRKKAAVYNCFLNLIKDVYAEEQFLKCQNLQGFSIDMDAANFSPESTRTLLSSWLVMQHLENQFDVGVLCISPDFFGLGPSFVLATLILSLNFCYFCQTIVLEDFPFQMQKKEYKNFPLCAEAQKWF